MRKYAESTTDLSADLHLTIRTRLRIRLRWFVLAILGVVLDRAAAPVPVAPGACLVVASFPDASTPPPRRTTRPPRARTKQSLRDMNVEQSAICRGTDCVVSQRAAVVVTGDDRTVLVEFVAHVCSGPECGLQQPPTPRPRPR